MKQIRIILYSHDSLGLGHVRRNPALASALSRREVLDSPEASIAEWDGIAHVRVEVP